MNPFFAAYRLWRLATAPTPPIVRKALWLRDSVRDGAGLINDVLPDAASPAAREEGSDPLHA